MQRSLPENVAPVGVVANLYLKGETMEEKKENIVCTVCREYGPGKLNDCHIDFMNCRVYDDLVKRLAERLKTDVRDQAQEDA